MTKTIKKKPRKPVQSAKAQTPRPAVAKLVADNFRRNCTELGVSLETYVAAKIFEASRDIQKAEDLEVIEMLLAGMSRLVREDAIAALEAL